MIASRFSQPRAALPDAAKEFYNALEAPALLKYPLLQLFQEFFREHGAAALMSGSGSTTFAVAPCRSSAQTILAEFQANERSPHPPIRL